MQCGILDWILRQKKDISRKTGENKMQPGVQVIVTYQCWFLSLTKGP